MSREYFTADASRPFADAVLIDGRTLYISGRIGLIAGTTKLPPTMEEEAHLVMQDLQRVLAMAGMSLDDLVSLQVFASDVSLWERFNAVYRGYFKGSCRRERFWVRGRYFLERDSNSKGSPSGLITPPMREVIQGRKRDGVPAPLYCLNFGGRYLAHNADR